MATRNSIPDKKTQETIERSNRDSLRWAAGLSLFFLGIFAAASVVFYFSDWQADYSVLHGIGSENPRFDDSVDNPCGPAGAWFAEQIIGRSFGLFGVILPLIVITLGLRIIRRRPLLVNHSVLSALMVLVLGSVTLGFAFGQRWEMFNSGWGGCYGIELAGLLTRTIGSVGTIILLAGGWILTGVFINRNFINTVNSAGNAVVDRGGQLVGTLRRKAVHTVQRPEPEAASERPEPASELFGSSARAAAKQEPLSEPARTAVAKEEASSVFREERPDSVLPPVSPASSAAAECPSDAEPDSLSELPASASAAMPEPIDLTVERRGDMDQFEEELRRMEHPLRRTEPAPEEDPFVELPVGGETLPPVEKEPEAPVSAEEPGADDDPFREISLHPEPEKTAESAEVAEPGRSDEPEPEAEPATEPVAEPAAKSAADPELVVTVTDNEVKMLDEREIDQSLYDPLKDLVYYAKPTPGLLENYPVDSRVSDQEIFDNKNRIKEILNSFGIPIQKINATTGPTVTLYEIVQGEGVRISKIQGLENDIAQSLKALGIRIIAPIPGRGTIGIEVPNMHKQIVSMYALICSPEYQNSKAELPVVIGRTIQNQPYVFDLAKTPHLLVAGATGQGKSVGLNAIITSLLYTKHPAQLKFVMIDPKMVEFSLYAGLEKHFLAKMESEEEPIITDPKKAVYTLHALEMEMEQRLELCKKAGVRNIVEYNEKFVNRRLPPPKGHRYLPYIVVVIDEFADLIMTAKEVERPVMRLAQKARAIGIHLIIATQRPDVRVITGGIKANFPARIAFRVMQMIDSRTIIDQPGAQQLIGRGDMLFSNNGELTRVQCALVETKEVERIVDYVSRQQGYTEAYPLPDYAPDSGEGGGGMGSEESGGSGKAIRYDALFAEIARTAVSQGSISVSMIQRNYEVGFNRAGRIMMQLQSAGIVGPQMGAKPRDILFHDLPSLEAKLQDLGVF